MAKKRGSEANGSVGVLRPAPGVVTFEDILCQRTVLHPGESALDQESFRKAIVADLDPETPMEKLIVENIVALEWSLARDQAYLRDLLRDRLVQEVTIALLRVDGSRPSAEVERSVQDLFRVDGPSPGDIGNALRDAGVDLSICLARARLSVAEEFHAGVAAQALAEQRRRKLLQDLARCDAVRRGRRAAEKVCDDGAP